MTLAQLNQLPADEAATQLLACCGSQNWATAMLQQRPYADSAQLQATAGNVWQQLTHADWLEAFSKHPKIGETGNVSKWSSEEQSGMNTAGVDVATTLAALNQTYFAKFGFIFIVCASGKSAAEMLALLEARLPNSPEKEIAIAAAEQAKITALRLAKLLSQ